MTKVFRRVRKFSILKGNKSYRELYDLCLKSRNMYNSTLFILRNLWFASYPKNGNTAEYYLSQIDEGIRKYVEPTEKVIKHKDGSPDTKRTYYNVVFHSDKNPDGKVSDEKAFYVIFHRMNHKDYEAIQVSSARSAIKLAFKSMKSFKSNLSKTYKDPTNQLGIPRPPKYRKRDILVPFTVDTCKTDKKDGSITINGNCKLDNVHFDEKNGKVKQIRVVPKNTTKSFDVEVVYEKTVEIGSVGTGTMGIDIGIDNLCAISTDSGKCSLISGGPAKNINQFFNKKLAKLQERYSKLNLYRGHKMCVLTRKRINKIETFMHQASRYIVDYAADNGIGKIVIGHNPPWKDRCLVGNKKGDETKHWYTKKLNQKFVQIPFNRLIGMIRYKAEELGIETVEVTEEYTSKCSAIDNEEICKHEDGTYKGERGGNHKKGFITNGKKLINADTNGSLNILRLGGVSKTIGNVTHSMFAPTKFKKIGFERYKTQSQNNVSGNGAEYVIEATVDGQGDGENHCPKNTLIVSDEVL